MNREDIIRMAREAGWSYLEAGMDVQRLERFAQLVAAAIQERYMQLFLDPENQPTQFGTATQEYREQEIKAEREVCAKLADEIDPVWESISDAIRARNKQ